jgi:hypothetical protein
VTRKLKTIHARHFDIGNDDSEILFGQFLDAFFAARRGRYAKALLLVKLPELLPEAVVIFDN